MDLSSFKKPLVSSASTALVEEFPLEGLNRLRDFLKTHYPQMHLSGIHQASSLALLISSIKEEFYRLPHVFVFPGEEELRTFLQALDFFSPSLVIHVLPQFDVSPYSGLYPNPRSLAQRLKWLHAAQTPKPGEIFVSTTSALQQKTLPFDVLSKNSYRFKVEDDLPSSLHQLLGQLGYISAPLIEDVGQYALRGGLVDIFSPAHNLPVRVELFGDTIESIKTFDPETGRSQDEIQSFELIPTSETLFIGEIRQQVAQKLKASLENREVSKEDLSQIQHDIVHEHRFPGYEFLLPYFYEAATLPLDHFSEEFCLWKLEPDRIFHKGDELLANFKAEYEESGDQIIHPAPEQLFASVDQVFSTSPSKEILVSSISMQWEDHEGERQIDFRMDPLREFSARAKSLSKKSEDIISFLKEKVEEWKGHDHQIFFSASTSSQMQRLQVILERAGFKSDSLSEEDFRWQSQLERQLQDPNLVTLIPRSLPESFRDGDSRLVFVSDYDLFGHRASKRKEKSQGSLEARVGALSFGDLKTGDFVVHKLHGVGVYEGLKVMPIQGVDAEFIQLKYKDNDRLYLPVYRIHQIQKYSGPSSAILVDKLGGQAWEKTKTKVRSHLRDVANELLQLYAQRSQLKRPPFKEPDTDYLSFEAAFPYDETEDQLKAIRNVIGDMTSDRPMDRLICGDVGFGKTEVAMRAAFKAVQDGKQVCLIAPTTVLTFQHVETFKKRFKGWSIVIKGLNRFVPKKEQSETLGLMKEGKVDIVIGTHRLLSKDVYFKDLGLLIVDEEQKFGVRHKERLRKMKASVDTLAMSATPIPRTLNMSLMGIRDLSIINTAPVDRVPTRTFVCKFDAETIHKSVVSEISRGGQVFFIHNRVQSIYALADELREILPEVRMKVAHGQMEEDELEKAMISFFNHEIDLLLCTTIIESGMDIPRANTMFIDQAHQLGLSQLYQLRGRVGRSKERAYCYLLVPNNKRVDKEAQERLRVIQENTALGSGFRIAHYDLELRGAGDLLGEEQSGHIKAVGYELYLELLDEAVRDVKGEPQKTDLEPEINLRIPAFIPDKYIDDLRIRLSYYKALSDVESPEDIERIEDELRDQFGKPPEEVLNLMGVMLIRKLCKDLGIRDLSSGPKSLSLSFTECTPLSPAKVIELSSRPNKKYQITPDSRLIVRMNEITWPRVFDELQYLVSQI